MYKLENLNKNIVLELWSGRANSGTIRISRKISDFKLIIFATGHEYYNCVSNIFPSSILIEMIKHYKTSNKIVEENAWYGSISITSNGGFYQLLGIKNETEIVIHHAAGLYLRQIYGIL